jgi:hypothetical protein
MPKFQEEIQPFQRHLPTFEVEIQPLDDDIADINMLTMFKRKELMDSPLIRIHKDIEFPNLSVGGDSPISVNMMPFDLFDPEHSLPDYLLGYVHIIKECRKYIKSYVLFEKQELENFSDIQHRIAYLTVDERPVSHRGASQRREGLHVESPGSMRPEEIIDKGHYTPDLGYYHRWGMGRSDGEYLVGGIFIVSNMANSTAVWNSKVHDTFGDVICKHGGLERCMLVN